MTRINCVPVQELTDKHLLAEYRELPRISGCIWKWFHKTINSANGITSWHCPAPHEQYTLGTGHVRFFYDKGEYLRKRFEEQIVPEMQKRGFKTNFTLYREHPEGFNKDWIPSESSMLVNRQRIANRLMSKKG